MSLLAQGAVTKEHRLDGLNKKHLLCTVVAFKKFKTKVLENQMLGGLLSDFHTTKISLHAQMAGRW